MKSSPSFSSRYNQGMIIGLFVILCSSVQGFSSTAPRISLNPLNPSSSKRMRRQNYAIFDTSLFAETMNVGIASKRRNNTDVVEEGNSTYRSSSPTSFFPLPVNIESTTSSGTSSSSTSTTNDANSYYQRGLATIVFITLLFSSNSPVIHAAFVSDSGGGAITAPPVLLLNAGVSTIALVGLLLGGDSLEANAPLSSTVESSSSGSESELMSSLVPSKLDTKSNIDKNDITLQAGMELGLWKFLGTTANLFGLAWTTAGHGALLIQLTTLIVPVVQGIQGVPIPRRIQLSIVLALAGVVSFTQDHTGMPTAIGDACCVLAAIFYATYDLRLYEWGKQVTPKDLITTKIGTQAILSILLLIGVEGMGMMGGGNGIEGFNSQLGTIEFLSEASRTPELWMKLVPVFLWSGVAVNAVAPFLQVSGQQAVGPTKCQTIYASQPLWAALISYVWLGETIGVQGIIGGSAFLVALFLAATTPAIPDETSSSR